MTTTGTFPVVVSAVFDSLLAFLLVSNLDSYYHNSKCIMLCWFVNKHIFGVLKKMNFTHDAVLLHAARN